MQITKVLALLAIVSVPAMAELTLDIAGGQTCVSGNILDLDNADEWGIDGVSYITFTLPEECCDWEFSVCGSVSAQAWVHVVHGPGGLFMHGPYTAEGMCAMNADNGTGTPECLPAGNYTVLLVCDNDWENPFVEFCVNGCNGGTAGTEDHPQAFDLESNYPNPFNPGTTVRFSLQETSEISLSVFDVSGRKVATLAEGLHQRGSHEAVFDGSNLSSGMYICTLKSGTHQVSQRMLLVK